MLRRLLCAFCGVPLDDVLDGFVGGFASDLGFHLVVRLGPTHPDQPFDEAGCDCGSEGDSYWKQERFVDCVGQNGFGPNGAVIATTVRLVGRGIVVVVRIVMPLFEADGFAEGGFERTDVVCTEKMDGEEGKREVDGGSGEVDTEGPPSVSTGEEFQTFSKGCFWWRCIRISVCVSI